MTDVVMWTIVGFMALSVLAVIAAVGQPRKPITPGSAVAVTVIYGLLILGTLYVGGAV